MPRRDVELPRERPEAGELVVELPVVRELRESPGGDLRRVVRVVGRERRVPVLVRRRGHGPRRAADHEHARRVGERTRAASNLGIDEEELLRADLDLAAVELEQRPPGEDDVQLLVAVRAEPRLVVGADEDVPGPHGAVRADAEPGRAERASDGMPQVVADLRVGKVGETNVASAVLALVLGHSQSPDE